MNRADRKLWAAARTLADLGELTAQWLEGRIASVPGYMPGWGPDPETAPHIPVLAAANRAGFLTVNSQSADGPWEAWVNGFVCDEALEWLRAACDRSGLVMSGRREREHFGDCRSRWVARSIRSEYGCEGLDDAWFVEIADPERRRNDRLWAVLADFASRTPSGAGVRSWPPAPDGQTFGDVVAAVAQCLFAAAVALALAGGIFNWLGTSWGVRVLAAWVAFCVAAAPLMDDLERGLIRFGERLDAALRRLARDA
jgi:hypothetical protein